MFENLINRHDVVPLVRRAWSRPGDLLARISGSERDRVQRTWAHAGSPPKHAWNLSAVQRRRNVLVSGDPDVDAVEYFSRRYLTGRSGLTAVSLACGSGERELRWARTGHFADIRAFDLSPARILAAREGASEAGLGGVLHFEVADALAFSLPPASVDVVIAEEALHHLTPLRQIVARVHGWLRPGGLLLIDEFVGPTRFSWTDRQLEAVNALLALLPQRYRKEWSTGRRRTRVHRPSRLRMRMADPSEAVESGVILATLDEFFAPLEIRETKGTIVDLVLGEIAQNFEPGDPSAEKWLGFLFEVEDALIASGDLTSDHVVGVFRA